MTLVCVLGDPHAHPGLDNDRFEHIGRYIAAREVDHIHCVGDWSDNPSLNEHKSKAEQRPDSYKKDVEAANDALRRFDAGLDGLPASKTITLGNHDAYPLRWVASNPSFEGVIGPGDVKFKAHGWKTYDYLAEPKIKGLLCSHHFPASPSSSRAQGGLHVAHHNVSKQGMSCVVGHNHIFDVKQRTLGDGQRIWGFSAGCMNHPKYDEAWCRQTKKHWCRGLLFITMHRGQVVGHEWVDYNQIRREL